MEPTTRIMAPWKMPPPPPKGQKPPAKLPSPTQGEIEVTAVHQERFVQDGAKARIEMTDVWVDPVTHGVRLIGRSTMPLTRLAAAPNGLAIWAARSDAQVHLVARREKPIELPDHPPTTPREFRLVSLTRSPLFLQTTTGERDASQCAFARMSLKAQKGSAEMAWFETQAVFVDPPDKKKPDVDDTSAGPAKEEEPGLRVRPLRATVSSTWSSKDKEPVLSVSFGWTGRERQM
jgi:hypothetical protein